MRKKRVKDESFRLNILLGVFLFTCLLFILRLFGIQIIDHNKYKTMASDQYWNLQEIPAKRGEIYSKDGFTLATTQTHYLLYLEPKKVLDADLTVEKLAEYLSKVRTVENELPEETHNRYEEYKGRIQNILVSDLFWAAVEHNITPPQKEEIERMDLSGVGFEEEPVRYYPEGSLASHVLGFVASNEKGEKQGYYGIEGYFDGDLKGKSGRIVQEKDATGTPILVGGYKRIDPMEGRNIVLSLDRSVQYIVEKLLKEGVEEYDAVSGSVIVMEPHTGEVIAMANYPSYDPADFTKESTESTSSKHRKTVERVNLAISETYEPGSVIKPFTISSAVDLKKVTPQTTFEDNGPVNYSGYVIDNWDGKHHATQTIIQLLQKSNNIGAAWVGHLVGSKDVYRYFSSFGFGSKLGIDLEGEDTGILRDSKSWTDIDLANIAFGQGMSATPLQVVNGFCSLANDGVLLQPKIVTKIKDQKEIIDIPTKEIRRVVSSETSQTMVDMLIEAVSGGESKFYNLKNYEIAGKTGTAQIPVGGKYDPMKTNATFVGFLANSRRFCMIVRLDRPSTSTYAAETAVPLWMSITNELVKYYGIPPDM